MASWTKPTPDQVVKAVAHLNREGQYRYFFDRLENPHWIGPLQSKGFFKKAPPPERSSVDGTVRFPPWPESRYLKRMATRDPKAVRDIIGRISTDNIAVHVDFVDAALAMPPEIAASLLRHARAWIDQPFVWPGLPDKVAELAARTVAQNPNDALALARTLLRLEPPPPADERTLTREPRSRFDAWEYSELVEKLRPALTAVVPDETLDLFSDLLEFVSRLDVVRAGDNAAAIEDHSYAWRPAIEDHGQNEPQGIRDALVVAVRDVASALATQGVPALRQVVERLEARKPKIFHRIAMHLIAGSAESVPDLVAQRLTDRSRFDDPGVHREYYHLANSGFGVLSAEQQQTILGWIEGGDDLEAYREMRRGFDGRDPTDDELARHRKYWQMKALAPLNGKLPEEWQQRFDALVAELGPPEHPDFLVYGSSVWVGPTSPKTANELLGMSDDELAEFLGTWRPAEDPRTPSAEGLGRALTAAVSESPERFARLGLSWSMLEPTYVRAVLQGLRESLRSGKPFRWEPILQLGLWVAKQPASADRPVGRPLDADPGWAWARKAVADLLGEGFESAKAGVPITLRDQAWQSLRLLAEDPDPTPETEGRYGGSNMDPATLSLNVTRGSAFHAVMRYALWIRRHLEKLEGGAERIERGFDEMPEVRTLLEAHLNAAFEPALSVRSVYGQWFPWLHLIDPKWGSNNADLIFAAPKDSDIPLAAWDAYIAFCPPYNAILEVLHPWYERAVDRLRSPEKKADRLIRPEERLAEHLMTFYWRGLLPLHTGLMAAFFDRAPAALRGHALEFIGRSLRNTEGPLEEQVAAKVRALWSWRLQLARESTDASEHANELESFTWWFIAGKLDARWSIEQLEAALSLLPKLDTVSGMVVKTLASHPGAAPGNVLKVLRLLIDRDKGGLGVLAWIDDARQVLAGVLQTPDETLRNDALNVIDSLGRRGFLQFRDLAQGARRLG